MKTIIIGVGVRARSGKDTIVKHLIETYNNKYDMRRYAFGDALKEELYDVLLDPLHKYWEMTGEYFTLPHPAVRFATRQEKLAWIEENRSVLVPHMQLYGTEFTRARDPFYWVRALDKRLKKEEPQFALISDVRFRNEFLYAKAHKGFTVKCVRLGFTDPSRDANHASETELDNAMFDWTIEVQDGAVEELCQDAVTVFESILERVTPEVPEVGDGFVAA